MRPPYEVIRIGTRRSPLAQAQTDRVIAQLPALRAQKVIMESEGDLDATRPVHQMERPGAFTSLLTDAILDGRIDAAVHSLKDLPLEAPKDAPIVAILPRDDPADVLIARDDALDAKRPLGLRAGARVGTSAPRRQSQLLAADAELVPIDVRGNVNTRLRLLGTGTLDALIMAAAAFERMPLQLPQGTTRHRLDPRRFPPGPGQGAIAIQARTNTLAASVLGKLDDALTRELVELERSLLARLGGGCGMPLGAYATREGHALHLCATLAPDGWEAHARTRLHRAISQGARAEDVLDDIIKALGAPLDAPRLADAENVVAMTLQPDACEAYDIALRNGGWQVAPWPLIATEPTGQAIPPRASEVAWIAVSSPRGAPHAAQALAAMGGPAPRFAALGPATARAMRRARLPVHVVSPEGTGASLAQAIAAFPAPPASVLLVEAEDALPDLAQGLSRAGFATLFWKCYRTRPVPTPPKMPARASALVLTSPSNVQAFLAVEPNLEGLLLIAFGPTTEAAMMNARLPVYATLPHPTPSALIEALR